MDDSMADLKVSWLAERRAELTAVQTDERKVDLRDMHSVAN